MTNREKERLTDQARAEAAKLTHDEYEKKTIPHPANKNAIAAFRKQWGKKLDDKLAYIERRESAGFYKDNPEAYKKDWDEAYYARFIVNIQDGAWENFFKE